MLERAIHLFQRLSVLRLRFGIDQVSNGFGACQIKFSGFESAPRKFPRLGQPSASRHDRG